MTDIGQTIGLTMLGVAYLLHVRWWHKPKKVNLYLSSPMPTPKTPDPALGDETGRRPPPMTFRSMGHARTSRDACDACGLTGQAFEMSRRKGWAICCPLQLIDGARPRGR